MKLLNESDIVVIYYSNHPSLNMDTVIELVQTKAKIEFQKLPDAIKNMNLKNALDIVILNDISRMIDNCQDEIVIISNDSGYDAVIHSYTANGKKLKRASSISRTSAPQPKPTASTASNIDEQGISALFKQELSGISVYRQEILTIIKTSKTRTEINNAINKKFHDDSGNIMKAIKPFIKHIPGG